MRSILHFFVLFVLLFSVSACSSDENNVPLSSDKLLKSFSILKSDNPEKIWNDCEGVISENTITLRLDKYDCLQGLKPAFKFIGKEVKINGVTQNSGTTANDFTSPMVLMVEAQDGSKVEYQLVVELAESSHKAQTSPVVDSF